MFNDAAQRLKRLRSNARYLRQEYKDSSEIRADVLRAIEEDVAWLRMLVDAQLRLPIGG